MSGPNRSSPPSAGSGTALQKDGVDLGPGPLNVLTSQAADFVQKGIDYGLRPTAEKIAAYLASLGEYVPCNTTGGTFIVTLPGNSNVAWARVGVHNRFLTGATNLTVVTQTPDVFDAAGGVASKTLAPGEYTVWKYVSGVYVPEMQGISRTAADSRYALAGTGGGTTLPTADGGDPTSTYGAADFIDGGTP